MYSYFENFDPVRLNKKENGFVLQVYGREYEFINSLLPTKITTLGESILYAPMTLNAMFGESKGEWQNFDYYLFSQDEERCVLLLSAKTENIIVNVTVTIECDGFIKYDLKVMNFWGLYSAEDGTPRITELYIDIPVKNEYSSLFHFWPNDKTSIIPSKTVLNTGKTQSTSFPFKPYIWTGWDKGGLGILLGESDKSFELADEERCIEITQEEYTNIRVHLLDNMPKDWQGRTDEWVNALNPVIFTLGFQATPVKRLPKKRDQLYKSFHLCSNGKHLLTLDDETINMCKEAGVKLIVLHQKWSSVQNYGLAENEEVLREFIQKCHSAGIKVLPYFGYEFASNHPLFSEKADEWLYKNVDGNYTGGWFRKDPDQRDFMACYMGGYRDILVERVINAMEYYGFDGLYTDGTHVPWECANEKHGCGYRDSEGTLHTTFPVFAVRELAKELYKEVHRRGGIVDTHQSSCCMMPILSFVDSYYDGENIQETIRKDLRFLNFEAIIGEFMGINFGLHCNLIAYTSEEMPIESLAGITVVHNLFPRAVKNEDLMYLSKVWKVFDKFNLDAARFIPYYENTAITIAEDDAFISLYDAENESIAAVCDLTNDRDKITLCCGNRFSKIEELLTGKMYDVNNGAATVDSSYGTLKMYRFTN